MEISANPKAALPQPDRQARATQPVVETARTSAADTLERAESRRPAGADEVRAAAEAVNKQLEIERRRVQLKVDDRNNTPVISVIDVDSDEVIRQLPAEHVLKLAQFRAENPPFPEPDSSAQLLSEKA